MRLIMILNLNNLKLISNLFLFYLNLLSLYLKSLIVNRKSEIANLKSKIPNPILSSTHDCQAKA